MASYIAVVHKEPGSSYGVSFPDFPGCISGGDTLDQARQGAREALQAHIDLMREDGDEIPAPSDLDAVVASAEYREDAGTAKAILFVDVEADRERAIKLSVTLPESLVAAIDGAASNRSRFLAEAARARLESGAVVVHDRTGRVVSVSKRGRPRKVAAES